MSSGCRVFVVVPAYNEARVICATLQSLVARGYSVVLVDDGSTDDTAQLASGLPVYVLRHRVNLGQGAALQTGMTFAIQQGADIILHFDADGQHGVNDIEALIEPLCTGAADVVFGSRFMRAADSRGLPLSRRVMLKGAILVNFLATGVWLSDAHNGFRAMTAAAARQLNLHENGFAHASEILWQVRRRHLRFVERPVTVKYTEYSLAKGQTIWNAFDILIDLFLGRLGT